MSDTRRTLVLPAIALASVALVGVILVWWRSSDAGKGKLDRPPAAVAVARVEHGPITLRRTFTGTLEASSSFSVAPKVSGRIKRLYVDIADKVERGTVVVQLDDAEFQQAVAQAEADLAVAKANLAEASSLEKIAEREIQRLIDLRRDGYTSQSQFDTAEAQQLTRQAQLKVAEAQVTRAESSLESARIRLGYTRVIADWDTPGGNRYVAERFVDEGDTVSANTSLLRIVDLDEMTAVIFVTERDYARLTAGQEASFVTDTFPNEIFRGTIARVAPYFREATRQARVELKVENQDGRLKPGMFLRATLTLERVADATIVPEAALTRRGGVDGVFLLDEATQTVRWKQIRTGVSSNGKLQVFGEGLEGRVVVIGQQLVDDGSPVTLPQDSSPPMTTDT